MFIISVAISLATLYQRNVTFRNFMQENCSSYDYTYAESDGEHDMDYWDVAIRDVLNWLGFEQQ